MDLRYGKAKWGPSGTRVKTSLQNWNKPLKWNREAALSGQRCLVFCASLADICEQWDGPVLDHHGVILDGVTLDTLRADLIELIRKTPHLTWLCLTKRETEISIIPALDNIWMGVTVEGAETDYRWRNFLQHMHHFKRRWISYEPALSRLPIENWTEVPDWIIFGGESDQHEKARPFEFNWLDEGLEQCRERGIVPFVKQMGDNVFVDGVRRTPFTTPAGSNPDEWPERFRVREFPRVESVVPA